MTVGILGGYGFLGTHVCKHLSDLGVPHIAGSRRSGVDARSMVSITDWIDQHKITSIINLAAECGGIGLNRDRPFDLWLATSQILASVMSASCLNRLEKLTTVGTVCSYAHSCPTPFRESDLMHHGMPESTNAAYGVAKLSGLLGSIAARKQYGLKSIFLLPANMYGPNDHFNDATSHVIPAIIKKCREAIDNGTQLRCWGSGNPTRDFLYVEDSAAAIVKAHQIYDSPEPMNIGTGVETSIAEVASTIAELMGYNDAILWDTTQPDGQPKRHLDTSLAERTLGFRAPTTLKDGLKKTISWYKENVNG